MFEWEDDFEPHILDRGRRYAQSGAVKQLKQHGCRIEGVVAGSEYYKVALELDEDGVVDAYCSCPYAEEGDLCKHMAAVLYAAFSESRQTGQQYAFDPEEGNAAAEKEGVQLIDKIIREADREKLEALLLEFACDDEKNEAHIRSVLSEPELAPGLHILKAEVDNIFHSYEGFGGYINDRDMWHFTSDLTTYLYNQTDRLLFEGRFSDAFDLSVYALVRWEDYDSDEFEEGSDMKETFYSIWLKIIAVCSQEEKRRIKDWLVKNIEDGSIDADFEDFVEYELADRDELLQKIENLDRKIEESGNATRCATVLTLHYGWPIEAINLRIILMKKLGAKDEEIDAFRRSHMNFQSVRAYYLEKAQEEKDTEEEIRLLKKSKLLDKESIYQTISYSERLIELYHLRKETALEKAERREAFLLNPSATVDDFRKYRELCTEEEWRQERDVLIESRKDKEKRCEFLAEEKMLPELYELISGSEEPFTLLNKYGFLLADNYSEAILEKYREFVKDLAENARNRSRYAEVTSYLRRMQQYRGGREMVHSLCSEWIEKYPTRKIMVEELRKLL